VAAGPFRWANKPNVKLVDCVSHSSQHHLVASCSYRGFVHTRSVDFVANEFSIVDEVTGSDGQHAIEQYWHFAVAPRETSPGHWAIGNLAELIADGGVLEPTWRSRCFGLKEPSWMVVVRRTTALPAKLRAYLRLNC
jgi:hypothetical protein